MDILAGVSGRRHTVVAMETTAAPDLRTQATTVLRRLVGRDDADFRDGQLEAVEALVGQRRRVLVVQRTGLGQVGGLLRVDRAAPGGGRRADRDRVAAARADA